MVGRQDLVAEDQESGQSLVGHGVAVLGVLEREGGEGTEHGMLLQSIIPLLMCGGYAGLVS